MEEHRKKREAEPKPWRKYMTPAMWEKLRLKRSATPAPLPVDPPLPLPVDTKRKKKNQPQQKTQKKVRKQKDQSGDEKEEKEFVMKWLEDYSWLDFNEKINKMTCKLLFKAQKKRTLSQRDRVAQIFVPVPLLDMLRAGHIKRPYKLT